MKLQRSLMVLLSVVVLAMLTVGLWYGKTRQAIDIGTFEDCAAAGYPILESYPPQCKIPDGRTFTQDIGNELEKQDLIRITTPRPNAVVAEPIVITGEARGFWFFEASFPIYLEDKGGKRMATTVAQAQGEWMTTEFVPFQVELDIPNTFSGPATLVLEKDNPSGLPEQADALRVPVVVRQASGVASVTPETMEVKVFFGNTQMISSGQDECTAVFPVIRQVVKTSGVARAAAEQLLGGVSDTEKSQGYYTSINPGVKIQALTVSDGVARIDLSGEIERAVGGSCRVVAIRTQIEETLKQFSTVREVIISVDGRTEDTLQP